MDLVQPAPDRVDDPQLAAPRTRVVIADDDEPTRVLIRTLVGLARHIEIVGEATGGADAVHLALERDADVALLDVDMPQIDGLEAAALIASRRPEVRLIVHTAYADTSTR